MWIYEQRSGKRTQATTEDAVQMVACGQFSALWPKGTDEQEAAELARLIKHDEDYPTRDQVADPDGTEVHAQRGSQVPVHEEDN